MALTPAGLAPTVIGGAGGVAALPDRAVWGGALPDTGWIPRAGRWGRNARGLVTAGTGRVGSSVSPGRDNRGGPAGSPWAAASPITLRIRQNAQHSPRHIVVLDRAVIQDWPCGPWRPAPRLTPPGRVHMVAEGFGTEGPFDSFRVVVARLRGCAGTPIFPDGGSRSPRRVCPDSLARRGDPWPWNRPETYPSEVCHAHAGSPGPVGPAPESPGPVGATP